MSLFHYLDGKVHEFLSRNGYVFMRKSNPNHYLGRRLKLMNTYGIDLVLDVGANTGQFATRLRELGYKGDIVSFEPMRSAYEQLLLNARNDQGWTSQPFALGEAETEMGIHVSGNSVSSSILPMLPEHEKHAPASRITGRETIQVRRMDGLSEWPDWRTRNGIWLKIDVQGYENQVLAGATGCLDDIAAIQLELSLRPLYAEQLTILPMMEKLADMGFEPVAFEPGFSDKESGEFLQVDGIFRNRRSR